MSQVSVVIIARDEAAHIAACVRSARLLSSDVIVVNAGSRDHTAALARKEGARVFNVRWQGYGASRNFGAAKALHHWILALDADERISPGLAAAVRQARLNEDYIYAFSRINYIGGKKIRWGTPGFEKVSRLYHRDHGHWDLTLVHECLEGRFRGKKSIAGHMDHFG